jgi:hypothetical protein
MQWNLRALFLLIAAAAGVLGVLRGFWVRTSPNHQLLLSVFLLVLSAIVVSAIPRNARFRGGLIGVAIFGLAYLSFVLKGGFGSRTFSEAQHLVRQIYMGFCLLPVAFLLSHLCVMLFWPDRLREP